MPLQVDVPHLHGLGVRGIINMCQEYPGPKPLYDKLSMEQLWLPTVDFNPPTLEQVASGVEFIRMHAERDQKVYVHCKAGRARSATVVICWLVQHRGMGLDEAQQHLLKCRPHVNSKLAERKVVQDFCKGLGVRQTDVNPG
jgi:atypical dual specificity phosphatase